MKFTAERSDILAAINRVSGVVVKRTPIEILGNVLIDAREDGLVTFRSTNLDMQSSATFPAEVARPGVITTPSATLQGIISNMVPGSQFAFSLDGDDVRAKVASGRSKFKLPVLSADMMPNMDDIGPAVKITLPASVIGELLGRVSYAVGHEETRHYLCGVFAHTRDGTFRVCALDGHRMALAIGPAVDAEIEGVIMPTDFVTMAERLLKEFGDEAVTLAVGSSLLSLTLGRTVLISKRVSGQYVDYTIPIPKENNLIIRVGREALEMAIKRATLVGSQGVILQATTDTLTVSARTTDTGEGHDEISAEFNGENFRGGLNASYLLAALSHTGADVIEMAVKDSNTAFIIRPIDNASTLFVINVQRI